MFCRFLFALLLLLPAAARAATVDTVAIASAAMQRSYRAAVVRPASYSLKNSKTHYPVLYLLHGAYGHFGDWLRKTPDALLLQRLADQYQLLIVCPEGETFSFYLDSPVNPASQFETYLTQDVIHEIDHRYRTVPSRRGRVVAGLSMGGHGALYLAARHPNLFCAAGSMSGALDLTYAARASTPDEAANRQKLFAPLLGPTGQTPDPYAANSVLTLLGQLRGLPILLDCGTDDALLETNREVHRRLLYQRIPHTYTERPGGHTWEYWQGALPAQVLFLWEELRSNGGLAGQ